MKSCILLIAALLMGNLVIAQDSFFVTDTIPTSEAKNHKGKYYTFCDEITYVEKFENVAQKPTLVTINKGNEGLTLVIYESDEASFDRPVSELFKVGNHICVQGQIIDFQGKPRIEIGNPKQVRLVK